MLAFCATVSAGRAQDVRRNADPYVVSCTCGPWSSGSWGLACIPGLGCVLQCKARCSTWYLGNIIRERKDLQGLSLRSYFTGRENHFERRLQSRAFIASQSVCGQGQVEGNKKCNVLA